MVLFRLMFKSFYENLIIDKLPNHMIYFHKQDVSNIKEINFFTNVTGLDLSCSSIDLSKLKTLCNIISLFNIEESNIYF